MTTLTWNNTSWTQPCKCPTFYCHIYDGGFIYKLLPLPSTRLWLYWVRCITALTLGRTLLTKWLHAPSTFPVVNDTKIVSYYWRICVFPWLEFTWIHILTLKSRAGIGVNLSMWIMDRASGRWPSREPTKNNLPDEKSNKRHLNFTIVCYLKVKVSVLVCVIEKLVMSKFLAFVNPIKG